MADNDKRALDDSSLPMVNNAPDGEAYRRISRKQFLLRLFTSCFVLTALLLFRYPFKTCRHEPPRVLSVVDEILADTPLLDGHNDLPIAIRFFYQNHIYKSNLTNETSLPGQVDFPRLRQGRIGAQFWSVYTSCPSAEASLMHVEDPFPDKIYTESIRETLQQIDLVQRLQDRFPANLVGARSADEVFANYKASPGRISSLLGAEGLHQIGNSPSTLRLYHALGVRYVTLTHVCHNKYADSANAPPYWHGLSAHGRKIVHEMNRIGMIVDLAHTSPDTMRQALETTKAPVLFSHACAYTLCQNPRNIPDDVLLQLKKNDGVAMITFLNEYVNCANPANASLSDVADHIEYVGNLIGYKHVGIGSDFDGMASAPIGLEDVSKYPALLEELASRGLTMDELKGIAGGNALRVLGAVEAVAHGMRDVEPLEDDVAKIKFEG